MSKPKNSKAYTIAAILVVLILVCITCQYFVGIAMMI